jgi:Flp pilus assembly protein protease CpaA
MAGALEIGVWSLLIGASITDLLWGKIYNALTLPFFFIGLTLQVYDSGFPALFNGIFATAAAFGLLFPLYFSKIMAAGDVKLLMAAGAWMTPKEVLNLALISILVGAAVGLFLVIAKNGVQGTFNHFSSRKTRIPFAPAFLCAFSILKVAEIRGWSLY